MTSPSHSSLRLGVWHPLKTFVPTGCVWQYNKPVKVQGNLVVMKSPPKCFVKLELEVYFCLFVYFVDSLVGLFSLSVNTRQTATCTHPFMHVDMQFVSRGLEGKKGLIHYFLALIGACKRIRRGRLSDGGRENTIWGVSQVDLLNEWILMQINANLCTEGSGSAWGGFDWQLQVCVCWGAMLGSGCFCVVGHGCLSMFYMLWIHWLHTSVA